MLKRSAVPPWCCNQPVQSSKQQQFTSDYSKPERRNMCYCHPIHLQLSSTKSVNNALWWNYWWRVQRFGGTFIRFTHLCENDSLRWRDIINESAVICSSQGYFMNYLVRWCEVYLTSPNPPTWENHYHPPPHDVHLIASYMTQLMCMTVVNRLESNIYIYINTTYSIMLMYTHFWYVCVLYLMSDELHNFFTDEGIW